MSFLSANPLLLLPLHILIYTKHTLQSIICSFPTTQIPLFIHPLNTTSIYSQTTALFISPPAIYQPLILSIITVLPPIEIGNHSLSYYSVHIPSPSHEMVLAGFSVLAHCKQSKIIFSGQIRAKNIELQKKFTVKKGTRNQIKKRELIKPEIGKGKFIN